MHDHDRRIGFTLLHVRGGKDQAGHVDFTVFEGDLSPRHSAVFADELVEVCQTGDRSLVDSCRGRCARVGISDGGEAGYAEK